jgi:hypothetical protein
MFITVRDELSRSVSILGYGLWWTRLERSKIEKSRLNPPENYIKSRIWIWGTVRIAAMDYPGQICPRSFFKPLDAYVDDLNL